jgi:hypothetical protein
MLENLYGKHAAALYAQAADFNKTARFYYMKAEDAYYLANAQASYDDWRRARRQWDYFYRCVHRALNLLYQNAILNEVIEHDILADISLFVWQPKVKELRAIFNILFHRTRLRCSHNRR